MRTVPFCLVREGGWLGREGRVDQSSFGNGVDDAGVDNGQERLLWTSLSSRTSLLVPKALRVEELSQMQQLVRRG
jgi:hypothetical protein